MSPARTILAAITLAMAGAFAACDAATFICYPDQGAANPAVCHCKADGIVCDDIGDCLAECPAP